jgi:hypothetical protein
VYNFILERLENGIEKFIFFSDNCGGQNKNKTMVGMFLHVIRTKSVQIIHYFLEKGHTQNEADSIHATIEKAAKRVNVFCPQQWYAVVQTAKKQRPYYNVREMEGLMLNFAEVSSHYCGNVSKDVYGSKVDWNKIHVLHFSHEQSNCFLFKHNYSDEFREVSLLKHNQSISSFGTVPVLLPTSSVTDKKKADLLWMCEQMIIRREYHKFYYGLSVCDASASNNDDNQDTGGADDSAVIENTDTTERIPTTRSKTAARGLLITIIIYFDKRYNCC